MGASFHETKCIACGQLLTDPRNAVVQSDVVNGGLKGRHINCPRDPEPQAQPGETHSADYQQGWDDAIAQVRQLIGERFPIPTKDSK